ncbi:hypothetical protein ACOKM5_36440 [Streptomyces sp. BH097]|uniref:hypothetical protein n=1 Tax=unclassified Streptomyces TaxID=2593676 RepID=UPI003BB6574F
MGASGWEYVTEYDGGSVEAALSRLHEREFAHQYGDGEEYGSIRELWADEEFMGEAGTHSILDIQQVVTKAADPSPRNVDDYGTLRPLARDRILHHFGTDRPSPEQFEAGLAAAYEAMSVFGNRPDTLIDECRMRWTGLYVELFTDGRPTHLGIFGCSGD